MEDIDGHCFKIGFIPGPSILSNRSLMQVEGSQKGGNGPWGSLPQPSLDDPKLVGNSCLSHQGCSEANVRGGSRAVNDCKFILPALALKR